MGGDPRFDRPPPAGAAIAAPAERKKPAREETHTPQDDLDPLTAPHHGRSNRNARRPSPRTGLCRPSPRTGLCLRRNGLPGVRGQRPAPGREDEAGGHQAADPVEAAPARQAERDVAGAQGAGPGGPAEDPGGHPGGRGRGRTAAGGGRGREGRLLREDVRDHCLRRAR